jgi:hypothetical protein
MATPIDNGARIVITLVTYTLSVGITLVRIGYKRTVIIIVQNAVIVIITVTSITYSVPIRVSLVWIRRELTVILIVGHAVVVVITVESIADTIIV